MLNDDNEYAACVNSSVQKLQQWLTKCKWKCENDHNRGTGNVEALEQKKKKCCQVESEHKDTSFDTLRHAVTLWSHKEVICLWNIERAQLRKKSLSPKRVFIQIVHITINLPFSMRDILLWTRVSFKAVVANLHDKSLLHWMSFIFWTYSIVFTSKWIDLTKSFCSLLIDLHPVMANMQYVYVTLC